MQPNSAHSVLWLVNISIIVSFVKIFELPPLIPTLVSDLGISYAQAGVFMSIYALAKCLGSSPAGFITDKWGAVPIMAGSLLGIGVFGLLGTLGNSYELLLLWRVLTAICVAVLFIAAVDAIPKIMPLEKVGFGIGLINGSLNIGIALALLLTPIITEFIDWRTALRATSGLCLMLFVLSLLQMRRNEAPEAGSRDGEGAIEESSSFSELLRDPVVLLLSIATGILFVEMYGMLTWLPPYLTDVYQYSASEVGLCSMMLGLAAIPASIVTGCLVTGMKRVLWLSLSGGVIASSGILLLLAVELSAWQAALVVAFLTWGHSQIIVTIMSLVSIIVPQNSTGKALGIVFTVGYGGSIFSTYLGGFLVSSTGSYSTSFTVFAFSSSLAAVFMYALYRRLLLAPTAQFC